MSVTASHVFQVTACVPPLVMCDTRGGFRRGWRESACSRRGRRTERAARV